MDSILVLKFVMLSVTILMVINIAILRANINKILDVLKHHADICDIIQTEIKRFTNNR